MEREERTYRCRRGHCFDVAREGYVNLLPANHRHSVSPGDDREMVTARTRFLDGGWYEPLRSTLCQLAGDVPGERKTLLDAGCGEGYYTVGLSEAVRKRGGCAAGVDLSKAAVKKAAKRCLNAEIAVSSVYRLPLMDATVDILVDCFSPLAVDEYHRVLRPGGSFLYVVPGPRHLWELKKVLYDEPYENEEKQEEYPGLQLKEIIPVETRFTLRQTEDIQALFHMTPYTWKTPKQSAQRLELLEEQTVTAQFRIHRFQKQ